MPCELVLDAQRQERTSQYFLFIQSPGGVDGLELQKTLPSLTTLGQKASSPKLVLEGVPGGDRTGHQRLIKT